MPRKSSTKDVSFETVTPWASFDLAMKGVLLKWGTLGAGNVARRTGKRNIENGNKFNKELEMNFVIGLRFKLAFVPIFLFPDPLALSSLPVPCFSKILMKGFLKYNYSNKG